MTNPSVTTLPTTQKTICPHCSRPAARDYRPFCSKRCADVDLGQWLNEGYRIPTHESPSSDQFEDDL